MLRLNVNPQVLAMCMGSLQGTPDELAYFTGQLQRSCTEVQLYESNPPATAGLDVVGPHASDKNGDWANMVHPHVLAQLVIDLGERLNQPCPDNTYVFDAGEWHPLSFFQPSAPPRAAATPPPLPAAPVAAPAAAPLPPQPSADALMAQMASPVVLQASSPLDNLNGDVAGYPPTPPLTVNAPAPAPVQAPAAAPVPAPAPTPAAAAPAAFPLVEWGMPAPIMLSTGKGASPFDKDPGGELPKSPPSRVIRDVLDMAPHLFATPPADVIGKGVGVTQRLRAFMAACAVVDAFLAGVPDQNTPVGYLRFHLSHMQYNAGQTAAGPTMKATADYLTAKVAGEK